jgi:hypothetical protein
VEESGEAAVAVGPLGSEVTADVVAVSGDTAVAGGGVDEVCVSGGAEEVVVAGGAEEVVGAGVVVELVCGG